MPRMTTRETESRPTLQASLEKRWMILHTKARQEKAVAKYYGGYGEIERTSEYCAQIVQLQEKIKEAKERAEGMNGEEALLGQPMTVFEQLESVPKTMAPYVSLWMFSIASWNA